MGMFDPIGSFLCSKNVQTAAYISRDKRGSGAPEHPSPVFVQPDFGLPRCSESSLERIGFRVFGPHKSALDVDFWRFSAKRRIVYYRPRRHNRRHFIVHFRSLICFGRPPCPIPLLCHGTATIPQLYRHCTAIAPPLTK